MKGTAHLGSYTVTLPVLCQRFNVWQGALPGSQGLSQRPAVDRWVLEQCVPRARRVCNSHQVLKWL